ncbi:MLP-like protein 28 [Mercurialis annua]|uniref:MLP-like protein 28 n=1 Tax=Mercurialis annua TaxID=3986 RepID=UPI00215EC301|nr:MLP-like protein 28 [Mercurialis annua]
MSLVRKLEAELELQYSSADKFFTLLSKEIYHTSKASSDKIQQIDVLQGDWETSGSVKLWSYTIDGKQEIFKEKVEVDEANKVVIMTAIEGHILEQYKSFKITHKAIPKSGGAADVLKITVEYEKLKPEDEPPTKYLDFILCVVKDVDVHLLKP